MIFTQSCLTHALGKQKMAYLVRKFTRRLKIAKLHDPSIFSILCSHKIPTIPATCVDMLFSYLTLRTDWQMCCLLI